MAIKLSCGCLMAIDGRVTVLCERHDSIQESEECNDAEIAAQQIARAQIHIQTIAGRQAAAEEARAKLADAEDALTEAYAVIELLNDHLGAWAVLEAFRGRATLFGAPAVTPEQIAKVMSAAENARHNLPEAVRRRIERNAKRDR